jgi:hypothetical protein
MCVANAYAFILFNSSHYHVNSHLGIYDYFLQRCNAVQPGRRSPTFQRNVLPPSSGLRSKLTPPLSSTGSVPGPSDNGYTLIDSLGVPFWPISEPGFSTHFTLLAGYLFGILFDAEDGETTFLQSVTELLPDCTTFLPRRYYSS